MPTHVDHFRLEHHSHTRGNRVNEKEYEEDAPAGGLISKLPSKNPYQPHTRRVFLELFLSVAFNLTRATEKEPFLRHLIILLLRNRIITITALMMITTEPSYRRGEHK